MTTEDFIIELYCRVDDELGEIEEHPQARLKVSEVVTLGLLFALKGVSGRAFYRWVSRDYRHLFPQLPERTRLFRLFNRHHPRTAQFMAAPSLIGLIDSFGIELIHPRREGRSPQQIGRKGTSNRRWIVGSKLALLLNHLGLVVAWAYDSANVYDGSAFQALVDGVADEMVVFCDPHFVKKGWEPTNLRPCKRGQWNTRLLIETVLSMLTVVCHFKQLYHRTHAYLEAHLAYAMALFNILVQWNELVPDEHGYVRLSIAQFSL